MRRVPLMRPNCALSSSRTFLHTGWPAHSATNVPCWPPAGLFSTVDDLALDRAARRLAGRPRG